MSREFLSNIMVVILLCCLGVMVLLFSGSGGDKERKEELQAQIRALTVQKEELKQGLNQSQPGRGALAMVVTGMNTTVYEQVYPLLKQQGYTATLGLSDVQMPGAAGCMSRAQYDEIIGSGWDLCAVPSEDVTSAAALEAWIGAFRGACERNGIPAVTSIYFRKGLYKEEYNALLETHGYTTVVAYDQVMEAVVDKCEGTMWYLSGYPWNVTGVVSRLESAIEGRGATVFEVRGEEESFGYALYASMLEGILGYTGKGSLMLGSLSQIREHIVHQQEEVKVWQQQQMINEESINTQIADIDAQLEQIYDAYRDVFE